MTRQEMFNKAVRGLRSQGFERSVDTTDPTVTDLRDAACLYDDGKGRHCAWGWVDEESWAYGSRSTYSIDTKLTVAVAENGDAVFIRGLQRAHDRGYTPDEMVLNLSRFARDYDLTFPED